MKIASVEHGADQLWGVITEDGEGLLAMTGLAATLRAFLESGGTASDLIGQGSRRVPLAEVRWAPPIPQPSKIWCTGLNFDDYRQQLGLDFLDAPNIFLKAPSALVGHDSEVAIPAGYGSVFDEWELTAVVGRELRNASPEEAQGAIFGYTITHDLTLHDLELVNRDHQQWAKNLDGFAPCGPWIVTPDQIDLSAGLTMRRYRNGVLEVTSNTSSMRYQPAEILSFISTFSTLLPGDLIPFGTPPAGPCAAGDSITGEIEGIGALTVHLVGRSTDPQWQTVLTRSANP
ncbi:MAG: fumarylacetoacetate hydrolase family protein [Acidimicrobiia bacterium]